MATRSSHASLPSDPDFLLHSFDEVAEESGSDEEFDGYLGPEDGPVAYLSGHHPDDHDYSTAPLVRSRSLDSLTELEHEQPESPLPRMSPSLSPMDGEHASGSPLTTSPTHSSTDAPESDCQVYINE